VASRTRQWTLSSLLVAGGVERFRLRQPTLKITGAVLMARVRGGKFASFLTADSLHALPKMNRLARVVARCCHEQQADVVSLRFMFSAERQQYTELGTGAEEAHDLALLLGIEITE
jgi:hypothetical protein